MGTSKGTFITYTTVLPSVSATHECLAKVIFMDCIHTPEEKPSHSHCISSLQTDDTMNRWTLGLEADYFQKSIRKLGSIAVTLQGFTNSKTENNFSACDPTILYTELSGVSGTTCGPWTLKASLQICLPTKNTDFLIAAAMASWKCTGTFGTPCNV